MSAATGTGIVLQPLIHRDEPRIALIFPYDQALIRKVRALPQAKNSYPITDTRHPITDTHVTTKCLESIQSPLDKLTLDDDCWKKRNGDTCLQGLTAG